MAQTTVQILQNWFERNAADLPWRHSRDPWAILVAEVMLQQTRVRTVLAYWDRFVARFPTPAHLAQASDEELLQAWSGLGYYRRARNLQRAAAAIVEYHSGIVPTGWAELNSLPGIGAYSCRSVAAIAYQCPVLPIDGNIARLLARLSGSARARRDMDTDQRLIWETALSRSDPGAVVQAMMEIGSLICLPRLPRCSECPLAADCRARKQHCPDQIGAHYGAVAPRSTPKTEHWVALIPHHQNSYFLTRRTAAGLLTGQWGWPLLSAEEWNVRQPTMLAYGDLHNRGGMEHRFTHRVWKVQIIEWQLVADCDLQQVQSQAGFSHGEWEPDPQSRLTSRAFQKIWGQFRKEVPPAT